MLIPGSIVSYAAIIALPLVVGFILARKFESSWRDSRTLFVAGALTFLASQALHIPFLQMLTNLFKNGVLPSPPPQASAAFNAILLGLLAGLFEESARFILFKVFLKSRRAWSDAVIVGLGHGGIEAILLGILAITALINMLALRNTSDLTKFGITANQLPLIQAQVQAYWSQPAVLPLFGFVERCTALALHIGLSVIVMYGVITKEWKWFWLAVLLHALVDGLAVYLSSSASVGIDLVIRILGLETLIALFSLVVLIKALGLRTNFQVQTELLPK